jgi:type II secretory pathway component PulK
MPYVAKNKPIDLIDELLYVKGMTPQILEKIRPYITVYGTGKVNLNTAQGPVLRAIGLSDATVRKILSYRAGRDQIPGTADDGIFSDITAVIPILKGFSFLEPPEETALQKLIQTGQIDVVSKNFAVQSLARLDYQKQALLVQCVVERYGKIRSWHETYLSVMQSSSSGQKTGVTYEKVA